MKKMAMVVSVAMTKNTAPILAKPSPRVVIFAMMNRSDFAIDEILVSGIVSDV